MHIPKINSEHATVNVLQWTRVHSRVHCWCQWFQIMRLLLMPSHSRVVANPWARLALRRRQWGCKSREAPLLMDHDNTREKCEGDWWMCPLTGLFWVRFVAHWPLPSPNGQQDKFSFFFQFLFLLYFALQYSIGFAIHWHESATGVHEFPNGQQDEFSTAKSQTCPPESEFVCEPSLLSGLEDIRQLSSSLGSQSYSMSILHLVNSQSLGNSQSYNFSSNHVWMWELVHEEDWALKNWCFWTVV